MPFSSNYVGFISIIIFVAKFELTIFEHENKQYPLVSNMYGHDKVDLYDSDGNPLCGEAMILPDGTKINRGKGFDYKDVFLASKPK